MPTGPVHTNHAPAAVGPYSQGFWGGDLFFSAGQIGLEPTTGEIVEGGVAAQAERALANLKVVLLEAGVSTAEVVKTTIYLADMADFAAVNEVYRRHFDPPHPARSTVQAGALPLGALVEIEVIAHQRG